MNVRGTIFLSREMRKSIYYLPGTDAERKSEDSRLLSHRQINPPQLIYLFNFHMYALAGFENI